ncbi:MAG: EcsC family protein [Candidatus Coatesbacteria bacterium]|nr:EcsC family protein [Candidatus Coatesbacteria bacterium]
MSDENIVIKTVSLAVEVTARGIPFLFSSPASLAKEYLEEKFDGNDKRVDVLIEREAKKAYRTGFLSGLTGFFGLPFEAAVLFYEIRIISAIATIYGYDINDSKIRNLIVLCIICDNIKEIREYGSKQKDILDTAKETMEKLPPKIAWKLTIKVAKLSVKWIFGKTIYKIIPVLTAFYSARSDKIDLKKYGKIAKEVFSDSDIVNGN